MQTQRRFDRLADQKDALQKEGSRESRYDAEVAKQELIINRLQQLLE